MPKTKLERWPQLKDGRWGVNDQPNIETVFDVLSNLPIDSIEMPKHDVLILRFWRKLQFREASILGRLNPDDPPEGCIHEDDMEVRFWWD